MTDPASTFTLIFSRCFLKEYDEEEYDEEDEEEFSQEQTMMDRRAGLIDNLQSRLASAGSAAPSRVQPPRPMAAAPLRQATYEDDDEEEYDEESDEEEYDEEEYDEEEAPRFPLQDGSDGRVLGRSVNNSSQPGTPSQPAYGAGRSGAVQPPNYSVVQHTPQQAVGNRRQVCSPPVEHLCITSAPVQAS